MQMANVDYNSWKVLGYFHYHDRVVCLKSHPEETDFVVLRMSQKVKEEPLHFPDLSPARDAFTDEVHDILYYTSGSDLSLFMQQRAQTTSPEF